MRLVPLAREALYPRIEEQLAMFGISTDFEIDDALARLDKEWNDFFATAKGEPLT